MKCKYKGAEPHIHMKVFTHTTVDLDSSSVTCTPKNKKIKSKSQLFTGNQSKIRMEIANPRENCKIKKGNFFTVVVFMAEVLLS